MTEEHAVAVSGAVGGTAISWLSLGIPNPIAVAVYALISSVVAWVIARVLEYVKKRLGL